MKKKKIKNLQLNKRNISVLNDKLSNQINGGSSLACTIITTSLLLDCFGNPSNGCPVTGGETDGHSNGAECPNDETIDILF